MTNTVWQIADPPTQKIRKALSGFPEPVQAVLNNRGIYDEKSARQFFDPTADQLHPPELFYGMADAVKVIEEAIEKKEKIVIHGDFDVDGVTATAILFDYLKKRRGADVVPYIPHRVDEGYGLTSASLKEVAKMGAKLVITVDCGIRDVELVESLCKTGIKVIITDHHEIRIENGKPYLPSASAVIHPKHPKGKYPFSELSGAAIAWKLVSAIEKSHVNEYIDLVALATVCDVMPLQGENRVIVKLGLEQLQNTSRQGLKALIKQSSTSDKTLQAYHLGFVLGPRLNAAGRLSSAMTALDLLVEDKEYEALVLAEELEKLNKERQALTSEAIDEAESMVKSQEGSMLYYFSSNQWKDGIIGLIAGRMIEKYSRPSVATRIIDSEAKGSARSIGKYNIVEAFSESKKWLDRYGGHSMAAGFSTDTKKEPYFKEALLAHANKHIKSEMLIKVLRIDCAVRSQDINFELTDYLNKLEPTGFGNPAPVFSFGPVTILNINTVGSGKNHLKLLVREVENSTSFECVWFEAPTFAFALNRGDSVTLACNISLNTWNGRSTVELRIRDLKV